MEEKLETLFKECKTELRKIGISFENKEINIHISKRNNKRYGCCRPEEPDEEYREVTKKGFKYLIKYNNYKKYNIEISSWVLNLDEKIIKNTIIHELIHCLPNCNNHGVYFKQYADMINKELGYNIKRVGNKKEDFEKSNLEYIQDEKYKYKIQCKKCGNSFYRQRLQKNFIKKYRCSKCLGRFEIINNLN